MPLSQIEGGTFERAKALIEQALLAGRAFQSKQTGFIHYYPHQREDEGYQAVPLYENFLFALALLRIRLVEQVNEAKNLLRTLLHYQCANGNFPVYMHEYPSSKDNLAGVVVLAPLYWILKQFGHVLGQDLRERLELAYSKLMEYGINFSQRTAMPHSLGVRFAGALVGGGKLLQNREWEQVGVNLLFKLAEVKDSWGSTAYLADQLVGLQMAEIDCFSPGPWEKFGKHLINTWQKALGVYVGPAVRELQYKFCPLPNLYDLYMSNFFGRFTERLDELAIYHLQGALIQPAEDIDLPLSVECMEGVYKSNRWYCKNEEKWSYALLEKDSTTLTSENTYTPLRIIWGDAKKVHSFVCQGTRSQEIKYQVHQDQIQLFFRLDQEVDLQDKEKQRNINFYFDFEPNYQILVNERSATIFELEDELVLQLGQERISIVFELVEGTGNFMGHISVGNRPSQAVHEADLRFEVYDWNVFLRTVRRNASCLIRVTLKPCSNPRSDDCVL